MQNQATTGTASDFRDVATQTLVVQAQDGNQGAIAALHERLFPRLTRWAEARLPRALVGHVRAEELVRDVFLSSLHRATYDQLDSSGFVLSLQEELARRIEEVRSDQAARPGSTPANDDAGTAPIEQIIDREALAQFHAAVRRLPSSQAELIMCRVEMQMSFEEIALHHGWASALAARTAFQQALVELAHVLGE